jgi:hypothetical protein
MSDNMINRIYGRLIKVEHKIDRLLRSSKPKSLQFFNEKSTTLLLLSDNMGTHIYGTPNVEKIFDVNVETDYHNIININVSSSFMVIADNIENCSLVMKLKINNILTTENEIFLKNDEYSNISLNYTQEIDINSIYEIEILYECYITTMSQLDVDPLVSIRNNGASLSILII